jgi:hypothetical protein
LIFAACSPSAGPSATDDDLTSKAATEKDLSLKAYVYVEENASTYSISSAIQQQVRTAFGPLRIGGVSVDDREFKNNIDPASFVKTVLEVVKKGGSGAPNTLVKKVTRVEYTYRARALVDNKVASQKTFPLALLVGSYQSFVNDIIKDCVENYEHDRDFADAFWYVWAPSEPACQQLIGKEVAELESERQGLAANQIGEKEYGRRYLPVSLELKSVDAPKTTFPEYDQLYGIDDPAKDRVVVYQVVGVASHSDDPIDQRYENDMGLQEFFKVTRVVWDKFRKTLHVAADSPCNPLSFSFKGKSYTGTFGDLYSWIVDQSNFPADVASADTRAFRRAIHDNVLLKWIKLEVPLTVSTARSTKNVVLELRLIFGADSGWNVRSYFREAFKNADVVLYDGHSYIGSGPLDPANYSVYDFADKYQILVFNSCVSFNYYGVSYFKLKNGGSKKLDLVTNGLEVWIQDGGRSMGQLIVALFDGQQNTWLKVLEKTQAQSWWGGVHDPNRNVDGELDNTYDPQATPITVTEGSAGPALTVKNTTAACGATASGTIELGAQSATATRVEFAVAGVTVATDTSVPFGATWDSKSVQNGPVEVTARAIDVAGASAEATCTVTVNNGGGTTTDLFSDDMEAGNSSWTATGLWHLAQSSTCASPGSASGIAAWYFGQDATCNYKATGAVKGILTSRAIDRISGTSKLSFKFFRETEQSAWGTFDKASVEVAVDGTSTWKEIWAKDCKEASTKAWAASSDLSLADYAGKNIRLRFSFDSGDSFDNEHVGWLVDDVRVTP